MGPDLTSLEPRVPPKPAINRGFTKRRVPVLV